MKYHETVMRSTPGTTQQCS